MIGRMSMSRPTAIATRAARVRARPIPTFDGRREFHPGDEVCSLRSVKNDGLYLHKEIGEVLVQEGDAGVVRENWCFLGEIYYTVEFVARAAVVVMRGREMVGAP